LGSHAQRVATSCSVTAAEVVDGMGSRLDRVAPFGQGAIISRCPSAIGEPVVPLSPLAHHCYTMACNNAWSNLRLLTACAKLSQADFVATRTSF
jgi:hypothetical protein